MSHHLSFRPLTLIFLVSPLLAGALNATPASAGIDLCRTDPIVWLSNGTELHLKATISDNAADVHTVQYVLELPENVTVSRTVFTGSQLRGKEEMLTQTSPSPKAVTVQTLVSTGTADLPVTVSAAVPGGGSGAKSGATGTPVSLTLAL